MGRSFPLHTSAKWQLPSPGSLQNSTTSRHVVSGVIGTSVKICSLLLKNTVNIIGIIAARVRGALGRLTGRSAPRRARRSGRPHRPRARRRALWPSRGGGGCGGLQSLAGPVAAAGVLRRCPGTGCRRRRRRRLRPWGRSARGRRARRGPPVARTRGPRTSPPPPPRGGGGPGEQEDAEARSRLSPQPQPSRRRDAPQGGVQLPPPPLPDARGLAHAPPRALEPERGQNRRLLRLNPTRVPAAATAAAAIFRSTSVFRDRKSVV